MSTSKDTKYFYSGLCAIEELQAEIDKAITTYQPFHSAHEGWAIIKEELDELWEEVRKKPANRNIEVMYREAIQVAAMAVRFVIDLLELPHKSEQV